MHLRHLTHDGLAAVLHELRSLRDAHPAEEEIRKKLAPLEKQAARKQYH